MDQKESPGESLQVFAACGLYRSGSYALIALANNANSLVIAATARHGDAKKNPESKRGERRRISAGREAADTHGQVHGRMAFGVADSGRDPQGSRR